MPDSVETPAVTTPAEPDYSTPQGREDHFQSAFNAALEEAPLETEDAAVKADTKVKIVEAEQAAAVKAKEADEEELETAPEDEEDEPQRPETDVVDKGALAKARRLFKEGDIAEALEVAGFDIDKINPTTKQWKAVKRYVADAKEEAQTAKVEAEGQIAKVREIAASLVPLAHGAQAYAKGDIALFLKLTTGDTPEEFQRKLIAQLHEAPRTDPRIEAKLNAIEAERAAERAEAKRLKEENDTLVAAQAEVKWLSEMSAELKEDSDYAKYSTNEKFLKDVLDTQRANTNHKTKTTLSHTDAAELVLAEWRKVYGGVVDDPSPAGGKTGSTRSDRANSDKTGRGGLNGASKKTNLRHATNTEAAPDEFDAEWSRANQEKILESYIRKAKSEARA